MTDWRYEFKGGMYDRHDRVRGRLWWKEKWISICSKHVTYDTECQTCQAGHWTNLIRKSLESALYKRCKKCWMWWVNRPNHPMTKFLLDTFPNMRKKKDD